MSFGACYKQNNLMWAGRNLAQLPVDAKVGKLLLLGASLGCLSPALTIAACLSYKSPFAAPFEQQDAAMRAKQAFGSSGNNYSLPSINLRGMGCILKMCSR